MALPDCTTVCVVIGTDTDWTGGVGIDKAVRVATRTWSLVVTIFAGKVTILYLGANSLLTIFGRRVVKFGLWATSLYAGITT